MANRVLMAEESKVLVCLGLMGRPRLCWMEGMKGALSSKGMTPEARRQCAKHRKDLRAQVHV